jgi:NAD(P) transhydrogenase subunit beta
MIQEIYIQLVYLASVCCFIIGLKKLGNYKTARLGNALASLAMLVAIIATLLHKDLAGFTTIAIGLVIGSVVGATVAIRVQMTGMPELVALFNGFGGLASTLVALGEQARLGKLAPAVTEAANTATELTTTPTTGHAGIDLITAVILALSILIGSVTFSGSLVAFGKLAGKIVPSHPVTYPMQKIGNAILFLAILALFYPLATDPGVAWPLWIMLLLSLGLGILLVIPIGGADMPVVVSLLNSYSGLAACATGFVLQNQLLITAGSLVGAAGLILTVLMCKAMNRSLTNVIFGAFGAVDPAATGKAEKRTVTNYTVQDVAMRLENAASVVIVPGYGLAVARAQHITKELGNLLESNGTDVKYAIHPVAGRMPGHMNVLLAEADVPYEQLVEMDNINPDLESTDVCLILGANDVVNPAARDDKTSPIFGMPILEVDKARTVVVCKRSLSPGFAGIDNELFYLDKTMMLFGDAKASIASLVETLRKGKD